MSSETHLKPAFSDSKLNVEQLSPEEFHRKLYAFFEDRGVLSDLRSHLRTKMINVLKETPIGRSDWKKSMSPKLQAINLLFAEFLIQQNCFYSLSVFSTEVPLASILPELNGNFVKKPESGWKFERKEAFDILETLGFEKDGEILESYYGVDNRESLLWCILKAFLRHLKTVTFVEKEGIAFKDITEILKASNVPLLTVEIILKKFAETKDEIIREQSEKYQKLLAEAKGEAEIALLQAKTSEEIKQMWENKSEALELKEKQLQEKERELQTKVQNLDEMQKVYAKNESECELLKRKIAELREENIRLENSNGEQRKKAEKLKVNARLLTSELSAARAHRRGRVASTLQASGVSVSGEGEQGKKFNGAILDFHVMEVNKNKNAKMEIKTSKHFLLKHLELLFKVVCCRIFNYHI